MSELPKLDSVQESRHLKLGYHCMMIEGPQFNDQMGKCQTLERAFLFTLEVEHMRVPDELTFDALADQIPNNHHSRIKRIWTKVVEMRDAWEDSVAALNFKWRHAPDTPDLSAKDTVESTTLALRDEFKTAAAAIISIYPISKRGSERAKLAQWKSEEEALRMQYYNADKNYLAVLRLYYEMLLEKSDEKPKDLVDEKTTPASVLPLNHPLRSQIAVRNRYLRLIDATHQGISIAKAAHHAQAVRRLRKTENIPYVFHPFAVVMGYILDVVPFVIEEEGEMRHNVVIGTIASALHDVGEDTQLTLRDVLRDFLRTRADKIDSGIDQTIQSGFGRSRGEVKRKMLDLLPSKVLHELQIILNVLSHSPALPDPDWQPALQETLETFRQFPDSFEKQIDAFIARLHFMKPGLKQHALIIKLEDRAHNLSDCELLPPSTQATKLRSTVSRLLAYAMLDYDAQNLPLYNALPRLMDITLREYERFVKDHPELVQPSDQQFIDQLKMWQSSMKKFELPAKVADVVYRYDAERASHEIDDRRRGVLDRLFQWRKK